MLESGRPVTLSDADASPRRAAESRARTLFYIATAVLAAVVPLVLIAGLIARRIVTFVGEGASVARGERIGLIRFGSRVDVYLPAGSEVLAVKGQTAIGGETVLAEFAPHQVEH